MIFAFEYYVATMRRRDCALSSLVVNSQSKKECYSYFIACSGIVWFDLALHICMFLFYHLFLFGFCFVLFLILFLPQRVSWFVIETDLFVYYSQTWHTTFIENVNSRCTCHVCDFKFRSYPFSLIALNIWTKKRTIETKWKIIVFIFSTTDSFVNKMQTKDSFFLLKKNEKKNDREVHYDKMGLT